MYKVTREVHIKKGHLELNELPFSDDTIVNVVIFPKVDLEKMLFEQAQVLSQSIRGNLSDDIAKERGTA
jgi:hypothetical protein